MPSRAICGEKYQYKRPINQILGWQCLSSGIHSTQLRASCEWLTNLLGPVLRKISFLNTNASGYLELKSKLLEPLTMLRRLLAHLQNVERNKYIKCNDPNGLDLGLSALQHQHPLWTWLKCEFSGCTSDLLNQKLWKWRPAVLC